VTAEATFLGCVKKVAGATVTVEISELIPSSNPIINGRVHRLGQIGSFVRIPVGFLNLFGIVSMVGVSELLPKPEEEMFNPENGKRWLEVQLIGEAYGGEIFQRGVSVFPTLEDEVHVVTEEDLRIIYAPDGQSSIQIGNLAASENLKAYLNIDKLITRHCAIVGSTGSGKSNTVAAVLKAITNQGYPNSRVLVIDPHGEYGTAFAAEAKILSIGDVVNRLIIPFWAMSFEELAWFLVDKKIPNDSPQDLTLRDKISTLKQKNYNAIKAGSIPPEFVTADSPIPFSLKQIWYELDREVRVTYDDPARSKEALLKEGNPEMLQSASFKPHSTTNTAPYKPIQASLMGPYANRIVSRLRDNRFNFLLDTGDYNGTTLDLHNLVESWINHDKQITVLDLGGIPSDLIDLIVGALTRIIYESMYWGRDLPGVGKSRPLLIVLEEAHAYLPKGVGTQSVVGYASRSVRRILKEGRKYGIGALIVSQRPSELDETVLSQCGTFISLRLTNPDDQARVKSAIPDTLARLTDLLPALRTGEAIVIGEATQIPSRIRMPLVEPRPSSNDPLVGKSWQGERLASSGYDKAVTAWRRQSNVT
jgi:hypothetical protein